MVTPALPTYHEVGNKSFSGEISCSVSLPTSHQGASGIRNRLKTPDPYGVPALKPNHRNQSPFQNALDSSVGQQHLRAWLGLRTLRAVIDVQGNMIYLSDVPRLHMPVRLV